LEPVREKDKASVKPDPSGKTFTDNLTKLNDLLQQSVKSEHPPADLEHIERKDLHTQLNKRFPYLWEKTKAAKKPVDPKATKHL
jgi:hypothetical protein